MECPYNPATIRPDTGGRCVQIAPRKSVERTLRRQGSVCLGRLDDLLVRQIGKCCPDIVHVAFAQPLDVETVIRMREAASGAFFLGLDVDL